ncbi:Mut7-C RNAse domain-containing protein [Pseudoroseomonas ludipueritiae]|uniref:Mut7-C RNAse domain-containing protein n=1 Tax=Pseudoroseomonas ludipueritiae TaxID=198093 RepID=A0ABR7R7E3_9PROT|nr:Mut7-C RNAse domain-containing protein [Pseudoroseomonas ludipueritiae]MBC9177714.1 hypothetical protein [Pseudoroseomonas ludipueritiae]
MTGSAADPEQGPGTARLLCDEMLAGLAAMLRAAGHDTALAASGTPDAELAALCRAEGRVLLSRDKRLVAAVPGALLLAEEAMEAQARKLARQLGLDWCYAPFTRCMRDNTPLHPAGVEDWARIPPRARLLSGPFRACPCCGRVYWPGSHVRRMEERLRRWRLEAGQERAAG